MHARMCEKKARGDIQSPSSEYTEGTAVNRGGGGGGGVGDHRLLGRGGANRSDARFVLT